MAIARRHTLVLLLSAVTLAAQQANVAGNISAGLFRHHYITTDIHQTKPSSCCYGTPVLADFDKDGDLDYAFSTRGEGLYWFENKGSNNWQQRVAAQTGLSQLGAAGMDVDRDGWPDIVVGGLWFRNPRTPSRTPFVPYTFDSTVKGEIHDVVAADVDGDGVDDIVLYGENFGCYWYRVPPHPEQTSNWPRVLITLAGLNKGPSRIHSGIAPHGVADLDGDGDADIALPDRWLENRERGTQWIEHKLPFGKIGPYGLSSRAWIADINRDGHADIVIADSDQKACRIAWLKSDGAKPPSFLPQPLPLTAAGTRGSFHSLAVADFDGDGDLDILTAEQEDPTIAPQGASPRWYIWENIDGKGRDFRERVIYDGRLGGHDVIIGDIDGDGDLDFASKIWRRSAESANNGRFHADWFENLLKSR